MSTFEEWRHALTRVLARQAPPAKLRKDLVTLLSADAPEAGEAIRDTAYAIKTEQCGAVVHLRGLIEISNLCVKDCLYCGIRRSNRSVVRYEMPREDVLSAAAFADAHGYGSICIQSGERSDARFVRGIESLVREITKRFDGRLGITLSCGEQKRDTYVRWFEAGAHRYLLRIETSSEKLYRFLHPADHGHASRLRCLDLLRATGYQVGTGVMVGVPSQTIEHLADDLLFFVDRDVDMIGMGPYVVHRKTPLGAMSRDGIADQEQRLRLSLRMIALARILLPDVNIVAATAMQALHPQGRELALLAGANIVMPVITASQYRKDYALYDGKPCIDETAEQCGSCLDARVAAIGETIEYGAWGDSRHALKRRRSA